MSIEEEGEEKQEEKDDTEDMEICKNETQDARGTHGYEWAGTQGEKRVGQGTCTVRSMVQQVWSIQQGSCSQFKLQRRRGTRLWRTDGDCTGLHWTALDCTRDGKGIGNGDGNGNVNLGKT
jgi:hypothetical protein